MNAEEVAVALRDLVENAREIACECNGAIGPADIAQLLAKIEDLACELDCSEIPPAAAFPVGAPAGVGLWDALFAARFERLAWRDRDGLEMPMARRALAEACARFADLGVAIEQDRALERIVEAGGDDGL